jgi:serine/threonine protein kinase
VLPGTKAVICNSCLHAFTVVPEARTVSSQPTAESGAREEAVVVTGPRLRVNCPRCSREFLVPLNETQAVCPRCGEAFQPGQRTGAPADLSARDTEKTLRSKPKEPSPPPAADTAVSEETAMQWMRTHFEGKYEVLSFLGRGGMGVVYKARQVRPVREVALKVMLGGAFASERHRKRFEREAQAVAGLNHPGIVPVYEYGEAGGQPYFTMEFVEGRNLRSYALSQNLSREQVCRLMVRVCNAIHYAHERGVIHRDLKPGNIMVDKLGRPRILDFGLSRTSMEGEDAASGLTVTGDFLGTPRYMSPEQAMGSPRDVDARTDVYALGIMLYETIVGMPPYPIDRARGLQALEILRDWQPVKPRDLHPDIPRDLELIMLKAIEKDKALRYSSADAMAQDLESFLEDRPISARPATIGYRLNKWAWRNRRVLTPIALSAIVIAVLTGAFMNRIKGLLTRLDRESRERLALQERVTGFLAGQPNAAARVEQLMVNDQWAAALWHAKGAPQLFPNQEGVSRLAAEVHRRAQKRAQDELGQFNQLLRQQEYDAATKKARALTALAELMPTEEEYDDLRGSLRDVEPKFSDRCWQDLQAAVSAGYLRKDVLERIDRYIAFEKARQSQPHLQEAEALRVRMDGEGPAFYLDKHAEAFRRAISAMTWTEAESILGSAQRVTETELTGEREAWRSKLAELRALLDSVIRQATAANLRWLRTLASAESSEGAQFVRALAFLPDGTRLVSGSEDGTITLWDPWTGKASGTAHGGTSIRSMAPSADGALLAVGHEDGSVQLWSLPNLKPARQLKGHAYGVRSVGFSPDGRLLLSADTESLLWWNPLDGTRVETGKVQGCSPAAFSPAGQLLAAAGTESGVQLWDLLADKARASLAEQSRPQALAFSQDGSMLAAAFEDGTVGLWQAQTGEEAGRFQAGERKVLSLAFSPDGQLLATGGADGMLTLWSLPAGSLLRVLEGHAHRIYATVFSADQRLIATGSADSTVRLWGTGPEAATQETTSP